MATGDKTKKLIAQFRDEIDDWAYAIVKNDILLLNEFNKFQADFMTRFNTNYKTYSFAMTEGETFYKINASVKNIEIWFFSDGIKRNPKITREHSAGGSVDYDRKALFLLEDITAGVTAYYAATVNNVNPMSYTVDPEIEDKFQPLLKEAVKSKYKHLFPEFMSLADVIELVRKLAKSQNVKQYFTIQDIGLTAP